MSKDSTTKTTSDKNMFGGGRRSPHHGCSMHGMPFHLQQWRPGPFLTATRKYSIPGDVWAGPKKVPASTSFQVTMDSFSACSGGLMVVSTCHQLSERAPGVAQPLRSCWRSARARKKEEGRGFRSKQSVAQG